MSKKGGCGMALLRYAFVNTLTFSLKIDREDLFRFVSICSRAPS